MLTSPPTPNTIVFGPKTGKNGLTTLALGMAFQPAQKKSPSLNPTALHQGFGPSKFISTTPSLSKKASTSKAHGTTGNLPDISTPATANVNQKQPKIGLFSLNKLLQNLVNNQHFLSKQNSKTTLQIHHFHSSPKYFP